jgi:hypothetical protein
MDKSSSLGMPMHHPKKYPRSTSVKAWGCVTTQIFQDLKISSCIHGILHHKVFSKVLNFIPSKDIVSNAFSNFRYKRFSERKCFKNEPHCYGAILYFPFVFFF